MKYRQHSCKHFIKHTFASIWTLHDLLALRSLTYISVKTVRVLSCLLCAVTESNKKHTSIWLTLQKYVNKCKPSKWIPSGLVLGVRHLWNRWYGTVSFEGFFFLNFIESIMYLNYVAQCTYLICLPWRCVYFHWKSFGAYSDSKLFFEMQNCYLN